MFERLFKTQPLFIDTLKGIPQAAVDTLKRGIAGQGVFSQQPAPPTFKSALIQGSQSLSKQTDPRTLEGQNFIIGSVGNLNNVGSKIPKQKVFKGFKDLSTTLLEKLKGKSVTSKQELLDFTNMPEVRQAERDVFRNLLKDEGDKVDVPKFANKVKSELLPLTPTKQVNSRYENISLPDEARGPVANYEERVYQSPIKTSAGDVHFSSYGSNSRRAGTDEAPNYFAHTRIEDVYNNQDLLDYKADKLKGFDNMRQDTRRVIEIQSDLFQKGRLEGERVVTQFEKDVQKRTNEMIAEGISPGQARINALREIGPDAENWPDYKKTLSLGKKRNAEVDKLEPYRNTWHERVIREEVKKAAIDGKTKLQFPTGETAMKIEGLGGGDARWIQDNGSNLFPEGLRVGKNLRQGENGTEWVVTDVLGDGKFKAVPKALLDDMPFARGFLNKDPKYKDITWQDIKDRLAETNGGRAEESFDISGKVDTNNPIYRFYEKEAGKYLTNKFGAKQITDPQGVKWWEVDIKPERAKEPVLAYGKVPIGVIGGGALGLGGLTALNTPSTTTYTRPPEPEVEQPKQYYVRDNVVTEPDIEEAKRVLFSEVSNREPQLQELEMRVILNTALNRMDEYRKHGQNLTLTEVLQMPNQYQGYNSPQYKLYSEQATDTPTTTKKKSTVQIMDKLLKEIENGSFQDNTNGAFYYSHKNGKIYYDDKKQLFAPTKRMKSESLFISN